MNLTIKKTTRGARLVPIYKGTTKRPVWTVIIDWHLVRRGEIVNKSAAMLAWLTDNMTAYRVFRVTDGSIATDRGIETVTFRNHADAVLFYIRFK